MILKDDCLYLLKTGKFADFDRVMPHAVGMGFEKVAANMLADAMISKMNAGRLKEIIENEKKINENTLDTLAKENKSFLIHKSEIEEIKFDEALFRLKLVTKQGKFKFYFSSATDQSKVKPLVQNLK